MFSTVTAASEDQTVSYRWRGFKEEDGAQLNFTLKPEDGDVTLNCTASGSTGNGSNMTTVKCTPEKPTIGLSNSGAPFSVLHLLSFSMAASPYLLSTIILGVKSYRARVNNRLTIFHCKTVERNASWDALQIQLPPVYLTITYWGQTGSSVFPWKEEVSSGFTAVLEITHLRKTPRTPAFVKELSSVLRSDVQSPTPADVSRSLRNSQPTISTPSTSSPTDRSRVIDLSTWLDKFKVPWSKMPQGIKLSINAQQRPTPRDRREMIRVIVDEIRLIEPNPTRSDCVTVAKMVVKEYPESFADILKDGTRIGSGFASLVNQLKRELNTSTVTV
ncbi:uncharacterized protein LOC125803959 [Astyanax mexicanus]|uniref:uncharacterized protein LOC125803959 n=1 Tax=Astyanax mexicanus TaxID=7994 RepID=UPI0020CB67C8|nr:uncharacterized protein LOC125803959 [Astyanax mexicanus]